MAGSRPSEGRPRGRSIVFGLTRHRERAASLAEVAAVLRDLLAEARTARATSGGTACTQHVEALRGVVEAVERARWSGVRLLAKDWPDHEGQPAEDVYGVGKR
jgi:hypothetical protein